MTQSTKQAAQLPTFVGSLKSGFDLTTRHWWLGILPFLVDLLLWLGPRLNYQILGERYLDFVVTQAEAPELSGRFPAVPVEEFSSLLERTNLLSSLSAPFFGVPILLNGLAQTETPIATQTIFLDSWQALGNNWLIIGLISMVLSATYLSLIASVVRDGYVDGADFGRNLLPNIFRLITVTIIAIILLIVIIFPMAFVGGIVGLLNQGLIFAVAIGGAIVLMWGIILLSFTAQALFLNRLSPLHAMLTSIRFIRHHLHKALPLLLSVVLIGSVTDSLWLIAYDGSWLVLVSLAGHAFIATALVVATFVFFQELTTVNPQEAAQIQA